jgi:hypothetical protein
MEARGTRRGRGKLRGVVLVLATLLIVGTMQAPAFAGKAFHKQLHPVVRSMGGTQYSLDAHFTATYRNRGWLQSYGVVKVRNGSRQKLHVTCDIRVKTGRVVIGSDHVDLVVPGFRSRTTSWGVEGGDESGKVTGIYRCSAS